MNKNTKTRNSGQNSGNGNSSTEVTKQFLTFMQDTLTNSVNLLSQKLDNFSEHLNGRVDALTMSVDTLHTKVKIYEEHSRGCDGKFDQIDGKFQESDVKFKRDLERGDALRDQMQDTKNVVAEIKTDKKADEKAESKSKSYITWIVGIAAIIMTLITVWQGFQGHNTYIKKDDLKQVIQDVIKDKGN